MKRWALVTVVLYGALLMLLSLAQVTSSLFAAPSSLAVYFLLNAAGFGLGEPRLELPRAACARRTPYPVYGRLPPPAGRDC